MNFKPVIIKAVDIPDAWFQCIYNLFDNCFSYKINKGSFEGETRYEYDFINIIIDKPYSESYDSMLPQIPAHLNIPNPVENGYIEQYLPYLMTGVRQPGEDYTYGQRIEAQIHIFIDILKQTPNTNQAILQVAGPDDCVIKNPPCLRHIDMRIKDNRLIFYPYFRSWDLWNGMPANLAAIAVLQKYMADEIGISSGPICASSKGLHIYGYVEQLAKLRAGK